MTIQEYLAKHQLLTDGSFGTYYASRYQTQEMPELANTQDKKRVLDIHSAYLEAGAKLIRTNTFASNTQAMRAEWDDVEKNIISAVEIAREAVSGSEDEIYIAGDIGPIPGDGSQSEEELIEQYVRIANVFINEGVRILTFETFPDMQQILPAIRKIKAVYNQRGVDGHGQTELFIMVQFSVNQFGYSSSGLSAKKLLREAAGRAEIDAVGLNCGVGPAHMQQILGSFHPENAYVIALPNAGYPKRMRDHITFSNDPEYFAGKMKDLAQSGVNILGGCCGTNPEFIRQVAEQVDISHAGEKRINREEEAVVKFTGEPKRDLESGSVGQDLEGKTKKQNDSKKEDQTAIDKKISKPIPKGFFYEKDGKIKTKKLIAVELAPPLNAQDEKLLEAARILERAGVDVVTFPDSPSGRTRADSVLMAEKVQRETSLTVMPHICCRDKNAIAMRSLFLGAHINDIHNMLIVTGDPVPSMARGDVKSVFNFDSVGLMKIALDMNEEIFVNNPVVYGGAINQGRRNLETEVRRVQKKLEAGAEFFFTQPVFTKEDAERVHRIKQQTGARILCGIMPFISKKNALFMKNEIAGIHVTDEIIGRYPEDASRQEGEAIGIALAKEVMELTKDYADGYYFSFPFNRVYLLEQILGSHIESII